MQVAATLLAMRPLDPLFHFPLNQLVGIGYVASSLTLLALAVSLLAAFILPNVQSVP